MRDALPLAERLSPDTVARLERAAHHRFATAEVLRTLPQPRRLEAMYLYGYCVEMWLCAAYYRSAGFGSNDVIDRDTRRRRMTQARQLQSPAGEFLMNSDPHPLVGWAKFLEWHRSASGELSVPQTQRLREAVNRAIIIYNHWRPELRYKVLDVTDTRIGAVRDVAAWFRDHHEELVEK